VLRRLLSLRTLVALMFVGLLAGLTLAAASASARHHPAKRHPATRHPATHRVTAKHHHQGRLKRHRFHLPPRRVGDPATQPNIVFVLTDDESMNLLHYMPNVLTMQQQGLTFNDYFVSDSLCCPSRASILSGNLPHDTGVYSNVGQHGGFNQFYTRGEEQHTFAVALKRAGYRTAMMGKYLNGYMGAGGKPSAAPPTYVPPGWTRWDVAGWGYPEFNYVLNENGALQSYGDQPSDYLTDVLADKAVDFIDDSTAAAKPFFLEVATFAPHSPYVPAPRNSDDFPGLDAPQGPNFDVLPSNAPHWLAGRQPLRSDQIARINHDYRKRAQAVEAVDAMIGRIQAALIANGVQGNTYVVFSSDNGLHMGEYRLMPGKETAFDTDIHVPLIVTGPGVPAGTSTDAMAENIDLAKTFEGIGGTSLPSDGHSLLPLLHGMVPIDWRDAILVEHRHDNARSDPDYQGRGSGNPPSYEAMRTSDSLYVEYANGEREYYNLALDPFELTNLAPYLTPTQLATLHTELVTMEQCHSGPACWTAMHVGALGTSLSRRRHPPSASRR
jgi:arylsulfatase A-like enzyme